MNANDLRVGMFDGDEHVGLTFVGRDRLRHVRSPHLVDAIGDDRAVVRLGRRRHSAMRRKQSIFAHYPPHPPRAGANAGDPEPRPYLPVALTMEFRGFDLAADVIGQFGVRTWPNGARPASGSLLGLLHA